MPQLSMHKSCRHSFSLILCLEFALIIMKFISLTLLAITAFIGLISRCTLANPDGFLSINCGTSKNETIGKMDWITDSLFIKFRNTSIMSPFSSNNRAFQYQSVAYFTNLEANKYCYLLPVTPHKQYLVRARFYFGGFENLPLASIFDLYIEGIKWAKVDLTNLFKNRTYYYDIILVPKGGSLSLCLARNSETQENCYVFISTIELRLLQFTMYDTYTDFNYSALNLFSRIHFGSSEWIRFPQDQYDRQWQPFQVWSTRNIGMNASSFGSMKNQPPVSVLKTAISSLVGEELFVSNWRLLNQGIYYFALYLCNINKTSLSGNNTFQVIIGNLQIAEIDVPEYMYCLSQESRVELSTTETINIRIRSQAGSHMRPFINAAEAYQILNITNMTHAGDVIAIRKIADTVNVPDDWTTGDPCLPAGLPLTVVMCNEEDPPRVIIV
ncbi:leucine-rich repeat receptor-like serine/threonine-protein kinase At2g14510 [Cryptomeria japonica]|uniref:leucine-rich repeat receptor-like serine/threonine-protein kinase At2g14510 n=1 Tax=Cryptomeria japonica TaxID=3369 RepID=UPI0027DA3487|nr:leucine-rich repeat receptor-like serine/threonine-protein kinase At2g14510 [Cryptomeria japonica]